MDEKLTGFSIDNELINLICETITIINNLKIKYKINDQNTNILEIKKIDVHDKNVFYNYFQDMSNASSNYLNFKPHSDDVKDKLINNLYIWFNNFDNKIHPLLARTIFLYSVIFIYPYNSKNMSKIINWYHILLIQYDEYFALTSFTKTMFNKKSFFKSINDSYLNNDINYFIKYILKTLNSRLKKINIKDKILDTESYKLNRLLNVMDDNNPMSAYEIMEKLKIKSKETFRSSYMDLAIKKGMVLMTIPDKPTSRNQMYYKV